jgi:TolB-like protein/Tfp pilus assembly protein PilF
VQAAARIFREARRRKVFRTGALYVVGAWLVMQVADVLFPAFGIPGAAIRALVWAVVAGFPVALVFGWLFEISLDGIRRTLPADVESPDAPRPLTRKDYIILAVFGVVTVGLIVQTGHSVRAVPKDLSRVTDRDVGSDKTGRLGNSIAVLPFANISSDRENDYFCDGIAEDILNKLSGVRELNVIGRTSSFAFKDSDFNAQRIGAVLNVRYVLQGSVRKVGGQLRISAQLVDDHGVQVWGESFDRQLRNVFEIQSEIADAVTRIVAARIVQGHPETVHQPPIEAYQHYLAGREFVHARDGAGAAAELQRAVELDPEFADAYAELAISHLLSGEPADWEARARAAIERATQLAPQLLRAQAAKGLLLLVQKPPDPAAAEQVLRELLEQDPSMSDALLWLHNALQLQRRDAEARPVLERAYLVDPLHPAIVGNLSGLLMNEGEVDRAVAIMERQLEQPRPGFIVYLGLRGYYVGRGQLARAHELAKTAILKGAAPAYAPMVFDSAWFGDFAASQAWIERTQQDYPDFEMNRLMAVHVLTWQGRSDEAMRRLHSFMDEAQIRPGIEDTDFALIAGGLLSRGGEYETAVTLLEPVVNPDDPGDDDWSPPVSAIFGLNALAWAYQHTGATDKATWLLVGYLQKCAQAEKSGKYRSGRTLEHCAEAHLLLGHDDQALAWLEKAVNAGWREYYLRLHDPYWARLKDNPRYRKLMATVKADVDRQHAEALAQDRKDNFAARLETVRKARLGAQYRPWSQAAQN